MRKIFTVLNFVNAIFGAVLIHLGWVAIGPLAGLCIGIGLLILIIWNVASAVQDGIKIGKALR